MTFRVLTSSLDVLHRVAAGVPADQLGAPTPCSQWTVAQVLLHAAGDQLPVLPEGAAGAGPVVLHR